MGKRIVFMGAGAVGGYVGGHLARSGEDVTLIDPWPEHIDYIKQNGIHLGGTQGDHVVRVKALHLYEVQSLYRTPADIAFIGWGKVIGCIASTIGVDAIKAGHILRNMQPGGSAYTVFRVGEVHGRITPRAQELAHMLAVVDSAKVTTNLWGERWSKLTQNSMGNGISACTGMNSKALVAWKTSRRVSIRLAGEAIRIGRALGYDLESIRGVPPEKWVAASDGDPAALEAVEGAILAAMERMTEKGRPSTGQDILKGRRTEIDFINGLIVKKGEEVGIPAPTHAALTRLVKQVERGEIEAHQRNIEAL